MTTPLILQIRKIFEHNGIPFVPDDQLKHWSSFNYFGLHKNSRCLYLTHVLSPDEFLQVHVPSTMKPTEIERKYGVQGEWDPDNKFCSFSHTYLFRIPIINGLISGLSSAKEKATFFIDMARSR